MTNTVKETKAQRVERLKRERNPWEGLEDIRRFAREGFSSIPPEWIGTYFRWWGVYTQGDGAGVMGGKGGEGKAIPYFMVRIRIPNGLLRARQLRAIASVSEKYGRGTADLTVRQNIQLHWVTIEDLPEVLDELWRAGLTTTGACGDDARNITGCPLAGVDADEILDASPLALQANEFFVGNADFYNLPRKFKICITGCRSWCAYPEINDIGLTAVARKIRGHEEIGFSLRVGGGLSADPFLAARLNVFVKQDQAIPVLRGIAEIFRESSSLREHRERARLKFLFLRQGWTPESFQRELEARIGFRVSQRRGSSSQQRSTRQVRPKSDQRLELPRRQHFQAKRTQERPRPASNRQTDRHGRRRDPGFNKSRRRRPRPLSRQRDDLARGRTRGQTMLRRRTRSALRRYGHHALGALDPAASASDLRPVL